MTMRRRSARSTAGGLAFLLLALPGGCRSNGQVLMGAPSVAVADHADPSFSVGVVPTMAPPVRVGTVLGFHLSSSESGFAYLYLINASGEVTRLAENLPLAAGMQAAYPVPDDGIRIRASEPAGVDRLILLVTRQPFVGFTNTQGELATTPLMLASSAEAFLESLNEATEELAPRSWAVAEARVEVVE